MKQRLLTAGVLALTALPAYAAEEGAALSPFAGNFGNALWTVGIFLIVLFVLGKFAWGPILSLLQEREKFIHDSLSQAKHDREQARAQLNEYTAQLQAARAEAAGLVADARRDSERLREDLKQQAKAEAATILKNAERQIELETGRAVQQIRQEAADISVMIASKLIGRNISREDNERLIEDALKELETRR